MLTGTFYVFTVPKGKFVLFLDSYHTPFFNTFFKILTFLGDGIWFGPVVIICLFIRYSWSAAFAVLGLIQLMAVQGFKRLVMGRMPRPVEYFKDIHQFQIVQGVDQHHFYSFPSGHTATAFGIATLLVLLIKPGKKVSVFLFALAVLIGISRIYLAQHFLEDVLAGAFLGTSLSFMVWYIHNSIEGRNPGSQIFNSSITRKSGVS